MTPLGESVPTKTAAANFSWPGPRGHWLLGCMRPLQKDAFHFYRTTWQTYGDYAHVRILPGVSVYVLTHPAAVEHILIKNHKNYRKPDYFTKPVRMLTGNGILTSQGDFWLRQRRLAQPAFLRNQAAKFGAHMTAAVDLLIAEWEQASSERTFDAAPEMMRSALRIVSTALFSSDASGEADAVGRAFRVTFARVSEKMNGRPTPPLWVPTLRNREFNQNKAIVDRVVLGLIESRRRNPTGANDVLDMLLAAQDAVTGAGMTDQQLRDEVLTLLVGGHETIGAAWSWACHLLSENQDVQEALCDEAGAHLKGRTPTPDDLPHMPLATAIFEETLRLYPPVWGQPRQSIDADEINGYPIPAKATVALLQTVTHRHPAFWTEPDRFDPERFLGQRGRDRPKTAFFPFGGGPRMCIGNHFAMIEGPLVLAALAQRFHFTPAPGHTVIPDATFTLRPKTGVKLIVKKRM